MPAVLLVDDQPEERRLLYHALKGAYRVHEACDGAGALRWILGHRIDVVILDLSFPPDLESAGEGIRLHDSIRRFAADLPVIVATGCADPGVEARLRARGVVAYLRKPVDPEAVLRAVSRALSKCAS